MLAVEHVTKSFPTVFGLPSLLKYAGRPPRRVALRDVNLVVERGELFGLVGPNGAGKTTLLKIMATLTIPDAGRILLDDIDIAQHPMAAKLRVGLCTSEERSFYYRLTARQNLEFFGALAGWRGHALIERIFEVAECVGLQDVLDRRFAEYSSGMRQRLTVARALLADPAVLFLDEPTRAVDPVHAEKLRELIRDELVGKLGKTVIVATNLLDEAWSLCDRIAILQSGTVIKVGAPQTLHHRRTSRYKIVLSGLHADFAARLRAITGCNDLTVENGAGLSVVTAAVNGSRHSLTSLLNALGSNGSLIHEVRLLEPSPVDVFKDVLGAAVHG